MKFRGALALVASASLLVAACGGSDDDVQSPVTTAPGVATSTSVGTETTLPTDEIDRDAVLRYAYYIALSRFDPHRANGSNDKPWLFAAYDRLVHVNSAGETVPGLAESWEFEEEGAVLQLNLRSGVVFHDGEVFNAEAVKANIERGQTLEGSAVRSLLAVITDVEIVDDLTVRLKLTSPNASLPAVLSTRAGAMVSPAAFDNEDLDIFPVGAGAYRVVAHIVDDRVTYERFEDYWDVENTMLAGIEMVLLVDVQTRLNAMQTGQIDAAELETIQIPDIERAGLNFKVAADVSFGLVQFNSALRPEFANPLVIRAINHAIDREAITEGVFFGFARPAVQPTPDGYFSNNPDYGPDYYEYNPELAKQLLTEAGYPDGFSFEMQTTTGPSRIATTEAIQAMLGEIGLTVSVNPIAGAGPFLDNIYGAKTGESWMLAWGGRPDPSITLGLLYTEGAYNNPGNRTTERVTELYQRSIRTFDQAERTAVLQELSAAIVEDALDVVVLYFPDKVVAWNDRVQNIDLWASGRPELRGVSMTKE